MSKNDLTRPLVAIIGRPNVGKSSLFNRIMGERVAIVEPTAGVTRDRLIMPVDLEDDGLRFDLMDTGGIGIVDRADLAESVEFQVEVGLHGATVVLFLVDAREGVTLLDEHVARLLRRGNHRIILFANKCETREATLSLSEFSSLGLGDARGLSAQEGRGMEELFQELRNYLPPAEEVPPADLGGPMRVAVIGRRNTGKSSFVNALTGEERVIVSDIAGTTRDAVDIGLEWQGQALTLVDTAGMHRRGKVQTAVEYFSLTRSDQAIRRADVVLLFLDLTETIARLDQELGRTIYDRYKPVVIVGTKSDLTPDTSASEFQDYVEHKFPHLRGAPVVMLSNITKKGMDRIMLEAFRLREEAEVSIPTGELNRAVKRAFERLRFRGRGERPKVFYATQLGSSPPSFLLFVNRKSLFDREAIRAISRALRRSLNFQHVPVRFILRERERSPSKKS